MNQPLTLMRNVYIFSFVWLTFFYTGFSQSHFNLPEKTFKSRVDFKLINNLMIIPVTINGVELSFLLDSGVSKPILFNNMHYQDSLQIRNVEVIYLRGLGADGAVKALKSKNNVFKLGKSINVHQEIFVIFDESLNFTPRLGVEVHGIIGFDIFKDFIVEINYTSKYLKLHDPDFYEYKKCRSCESFDLTFRQSKPYIDGSIYIDSKDIPVKLLIDTGGSDALWLFEDYEKGIYPIEDKHFHDFLGKGLSGSVYGKRTKIESFSLKNFKFEEVNVAFPDSASVSTARNYEARNGSISGELLKRFNLIMDYRNSKLTLKKNSNYNEPFYYNKSGITIEQDGVRVLKEIKNDPSFNYGKKSDNVIIVSAYPSYNFSFKPAYKIVELRKDSPAEKVGLLIGDIIISVNNKDTHTMKMQDIIRLFRDEDDKQIRIKVDRNGQFLDFKFRLEKLF